MSAREWVFWLPANTPEAGAVALKLRPRNAEAASIPLMHLRRGLADRDHICKVYSQVLFDTLFLILGLLRDLYFRI